MTSIFLQILRTKRTKKIAENIENEKFLKKSKKFSKRVFTNCVLCGKLWEKMKQGEKKCNG
jgi:hypothetical protein